MGLERLDSWLIPGSRNTHRSSEVCKIRLDLECD